MMRCTGVHSRLLFAVVLLAAPPAALDAQEETTFRACYVPKVGAMYLLDLPGLPTECLSTEHQEVSWSEGGAPAEGSVTTDLIADSAVNASKIRDGSITAAHLAAGAVTSSALTPNTVLSSHIADEAVGSGDLAPNSIASYHMQARSVGGQALDTRLTEIALVLSYPPGPERRPLITCPDDHVMLSVGWKIVEGDFEVPEAYPLSLHRWVVMIRNLSADLPATVEFRAICADLM